MPEDLILYRGITPGAVGFDVHGGYGETWTTDPDLAAAYARGEGGYVMQASLPASAKRLVLVTPTDDGGEYNWAGIEELVSVVQVPHLKRMFELAAPYEIWNDEWTLVLIEAGYQSIATAGLDGPEEYILNTAKLTVFD
jgi:hypothetical protein